MADNLYPSALARIRGTEFRLKRRLAWLQRGVVSWFEFPRSYSWMRMRFSALQEQMAQAILLFGREAWAQGWDVADSRIRRDRSRRQFDDKKPDIPEAPPIPAEWLTWYRATTDDALHRYSERTRRDFEGIITQGVIDGKTHAETMADLRDKHAGLTGWQAERISRTEMMRLWNMGHFGRMETEDEGLVGYEYSVVMDDRTSHICRPLAGLKVRRDEVKYLPPLHPHCRTVLSPLYDFDSVPDQEFDDPNEPAGTPGFGAVPRAPGGPPRASASGGGVPPVVPPAPSPPIAGGFDGWGRRIAASLQEFLTNVLTVLPNMRTIEAILEGVVSLHQSSDGPVIGSSFSPYFGNVTGTPFYAVSVSKGLTLILPGRHLTNEDLKPFVQKHIALLNEPRSIIGTWYDSVSNRTFVDITFLVHSRRTAERLARKYDQAGIYALHDGMQPAARFIDTGGSGEGDEDPTWPPHHKRLPRLRRGPSVSFDKPDGLPSAP